MKKTIKMIFAFAAFMFVIGTYIPSIYASAVSKVVEDLQVSEEHSDAVSNLKPSSYKQVKNITATAYAPGPHDNGKWGNLTHIGTQVRPGVIAVDPKVIPLGSKLYIEFPDGNGMYGVAEDTGGAIKGNRIDIAMWTVAQAYDFGIQNVKVYVLN